jgi:hypothetical protein
MLTNLAIFPQNPNARFKVARTQHATALDPWLIDENREKLKN